MPDILTAAERRMIDAFPKRRIQRIPTGATGDDSTYRYDGVKLVPVVDHGWRKQITAEANAAKRRKGNAMSIGARIDAARARREKLRAIYSGQTTAELVKMFGVSETTIHHDLARLRKEGLI